MFSKSRRFGETTHHSLPRDIRSLFRGQPNPFCAGFGNRDTDHKAYTHIGIPEAKVFIINHEGVVHHVNSAYAKTYESMSTIAESIFPPRETLEDDEEVSTCRRDRKRYNAARIYKMSMRRSRFGGGGPLKEVPDVEEEDEPQKEPQKSPSKTSSIRETLADSAGRRRSSLGESIVTEHSEAVSVPPLKRPP